jgi:ribosome modulation factor
MKDVTMHPLIAAYELGYHSGINGEDPRLCPFPKMTVEWKVWNEAQKRGADIAREALRHVTSLTGREGGKE